MLDVGEDVVNVNNRSTMFSAGVHTTGAHLSCCTLGVLGVVTVINGNGDGNIQCCRRCHQVRGADGVSTSTVGKGHVSRTDLANSLM